jgi:OmpA-OmpF porin, OOP family
MNFNKLLIWLLTVLWFAAGAWWYSHSSCSSCNAETAAVVDPVSNSSGPSFNFNDGSYALNNAENLRFAKSGYDPVVGNTMTTTLNDITKYTVEQNPSRLLTITGQYDSTEVNSSKFENLGLARADAVKKILIAKGISEKNIATRAEMNGGLYYKLSPDTLIGGILINIAAAENKTVDTAMAAPLFDPRTVYFNTGKNNLNITPELENYLVKAAAYLATNKDKKLLVTGHTDNVGDPNKNLNLSADRAAFVKTILSKRGIPASQIITEGKGMQVPIADNATEEGKAKNRRVTIVLQ